MLTGKTQAADSIPWDADATAFPTRKNLPGFPGAPEGAAWVWGREDQRGRLNLLTPTRVRAAAAEIKTGETARLDLPLDVPATPAFGRQAFQHEIHELVPGVAYDDVYHINTQSSTQWDGFRHVAHIRTQTFYNGAKSAEFQGPDATDKCSVHHWSAPGGNFSGRAVFLDYRAYADTRGIKYDTATSHGISHADLVECGKHQGLDIRPAAQGGDIHIGDILLVRSGWVQDYHARSKEENDKLALRPDAEAKWAGVVAEDPMLDWLHDCYFAAVGGDAPAFERWPFPQDGYCLHEYILAMWGMPLGEMLDLEYVSELCKKHKRYTFFFTSAPARCVGGVASAVNATAIF